MTAAEPELHVFRDDYEWYIASSIADAMAAQREFSGIDENDQDAEYWYQLPDESSLAIAPGEMDDWKVETKTCATWIAEKGRGFLCSTEY